MGVDGAWVQRPVTINPGQRLYYRYAYIHCDPNSADFALFEIVATAGNGYRQVLQDGLSMQADGSTATPWIVDSWPPAADPPLLTPFVGVARWLVCNGAAVKNSKAASVLTTGSYPSAWRAFPSTLLLDQAEVL